MPKRLLVTIDTEMDADIHWVKKYPRSFTSITVGIPNYLRPIWDKYKINPIYFVSPEVLGDEASCKILKDEIKKGAIIGAHLHPDFIDPEETPKDKLPLERFPCFGYSYDIEKAKIANLKKNIIESLGVSPVWYRAGRFGADDDTIKILSELGFKHDSSFTPGINWKLKGGPDYSTIENGPFKIDAYGICEHPITIFGKRFGYLGRKLPDNWIIYRWLRPTHMLYIEEKKLLQDLTKRGENELVMMFHSMEIMVNKTPYVRSKTMQRYYIWRLKRTLMCAKQMGYTSI